MLSHHGAGGARIALAQRAQKRAVVRKVARVVEALVLGRDVREPRHLRLIEHGDQQRISRARQEQPVKGVVRALGGGEILPRDRRFERGQRLFEFGELRGREALGGELRACLRDMRAHRVRNRSGFEQHAFVEHALAAARAGGDHDPPPRRLLDVAEAVQHAQRLAHGVAADAEQRREPRFRRQRLAGAQPLALDDAADFLRRPADHAVTPDRGGAVGHC